MKKNNNSRYTIGMLIKEMDSRYYSPLWRGVSCVAQEKDMNLFLFVDDPMRNINFQENKNNIFFSAANPEKLDGLIVVSAALVNHVEKNIFSSFLEPYRSIPIVSIAQPAEGVYSILIEGKNSMRKIIDHLIENHGCRNIAFIKGLPGYIEAEERFEGYLEALESHGIPLDKELIVQGNFISSGGEAGALKLLNNKNLKIDAIAAANDEMALGASKVIRKMGLRIPDNIIVTGFDNAELVDIPVPLTTVKNSVFEIARKSAEVLYAVLNGKEMPEVTYLPTEPIFRQSCGCKPPGLFSLDLINVSGHPGKLPDVDDIIGRMKFPGDKKDYFSALTRNLIEAFYNDLKNKNQKNDFLKLFEIILTQIDIDDNSQDNWKDNLNILSDSLIKNFSDEADIRLSGELLYQAQLMARNEVIRREKDFKNSMAQDLWNMRSITNDISSSITMDNLMLVIKQSFPDFGIKSCYITRFLDDGKADGQAEQKKFPPKSLLLSASSDNIHYTQKQKDIVFQTKEIVPDEFLPIHRRFTLIVMPLFQNNRITGFFIPELGPKVDVIYRILREQISNALVSCGLIQSTEEAKSELKSALLELQRSEERFREMAMFLPAVIIETDLKLALTFMNNKGFESLGLNGSVDLANANLLDFVHPDDRKRLKENCSRIVYGELPDISDIRMLNREGSEVNLISKASFIQRDGKIEGLRLSAIDIKPFITSVFTPDYTFFDNFHFSAREREIVDFILQGYKNKDIAGKLFISENTVKAHIYTIYTKMNVKNKTEFFETVKKYQVGRFGYSSFLFSILSGMIKE